MLWSINTPNPTEAPYGSTITMVPSLGHEPATVPNIPNTYSSPRPRRRSGGRAHRHADQRLDTTVPSGDVISTTPASGAQAPFGSAVTVTVSTGPPTTTVPNVIGDTVTPGHRRAAGGGPERVGCLGQPEQQRGGTQPSIGSTVPTGSSVQLFTH